VLDHLQVDGEVEAVEVEEQELLDLTLYLMQILEEMVEQD
jgi:hypothetical protein